MKDSLFRLAEDIGVSHSLLDTARFVASKWPKEQRRARVSFTVHRILAGISGETERFTAALSFRRGQEAGGCRTRRTGGRQAHPPQEKASAIHSLDQDEEGAAITLMTRCITQRQSRRAGQAEPRPPIGH